MSHDRYSVANHPAYCGVVCITQPCGILSDYVQNRLDVSTNDWIGDLKWQLQNDEITDRITPEMNARFAVDPWFPSFDVIRDIGITTQNVTPGHRNLVGGSGVVIKNVGMDLDAMVRKEPSALVFSVAEDRGEIRELLDRARSYFVDFTDGRERGDFNVKLEALGPALRREVPAIIHAHTEAEIRKAMRLAEEFGLRLIVSGAVQAHRLAPELARAGVGVILGDTASRLEAIRGGGKNCYSESFDLRIMRTGDSCPCGRRACGQHGQAAPRSIAPGLVQVGKSGALAVWPCPGAPGLAHATHR